MKNRVIKSFRFKQSTVENLESEAETLDVSQTEIVETALVRFFKRRKKQLKTMKTYNWNPEVTMADVQRHQRAIEASIKYYENRNNADKVQPLKDELSSLIRFYYNGIKN